MTMIQMNPESLNKSCISCLYSKASLFKLVPYIHNTLLRGLDNIQRPFTQFIQFKYNYDNEGTANVWKWWNNSCIKNSESEIKFNQDILWKHFILQYEFSYIWRENVWQYPLLSSVMFHLGAKQSNQCMDPQESMSSCRNCHLHPSTGCALKCQVSSMVQKSACLCKEKQVFSSIFSLKNWSAVSVPLRSI